MAPLPWGHATTWGSPWWNCSEDTYYVTRSLYIYTVSSVILIRFCQAIYSIADMRFSTQSFYKHPWGDYVQSIVHMSGLRTEDAIRSKSETWNPKGVTFKRGEADKQLCNTSYSLWDYRVERIVFICRDLFVRQIYESSSTEPNMGERAEFC